MTKIISGLHFLLSASECILPYLSETTKWDDLHTVKSGSEEVERIEYYLVRHFHSFSFRLLDKLPVICPNSDSCKENSQRGILEDHLKYRCDGTLVACQFAGAGCIFRGPVKKMKDHQVDCSFKKEGNILSFLYDITFTKRSLVFWKKLSPH